MNTAIEQTKKFKLSNYDDYIEVDKDTGTVIAEIADGIVNLSTNSLEVQRGYLLALSEMLAAAAEEFK